MVGRKRTWVKLGCAPFDFPRKDEIISIFQDEEI
jgi:hypothetical protein